MVEVRKPAVNAWAITTFANQLDKYPMWLSDDQAREISQNLISI